LRIQEDIMLISRMNANDANNANATNIVFVICGIRITLQNV